MPLQVYTPAKMEQIATTVAPVVETETRGELFRSVRSEDTLRVPLLVRRRHPRHIFLAVPLFLVIVFVVTFGWRFISTCRKHTSVALGKRRDFEANGPAQRGLSVSNPTYIRKGDSWNAYRRFHTTIMHRVNESGTEEYNSKANIGGSVRRRLIGSDSVLLRRLSDSNSNDSNASLSPDQRSSTHYTESLLYMLCQEAGTGTGDIFSQLLDLEGTDGGEGNYKYSDFSIADQELLGGHLESDKVEHDALFEATGGFSPSDSSLSALLDPGTVPSTVLADPLILAESPVFISETVPASSVQVHNLAHFPEAIEEGVSEVPLRGGRSPSPSEAGEVEYGGLLMLLQAHTGNIGNPALRLSPTHATEESIESLEAMQAVDKIRAAVELPSVELSKETTLPASSGPCTARTSQQSSAGEDTFEGEHMYVQISNKLFEKANGQEQEVPLSTSCGAPWSSMPVFIGVTGNRAFTKRRVIELRQLLSNPRATESEAVRALFLGRSILREIYPFSGALSRTRRYNYPSMASQLFHTVIRLDTLLWLNAVFPHVTCADAWWPQLVAHSNIKEALKIETDFKSKHTPFIRRCKKCVGLLIDQTRPLPEDISWIMTMFERYVSRATTPPFKTDAAADSVLSWLSQTQSFVEGASPPEAYLRTQHGSGTVEASMHVVQMPSETGWAGPFSGNAEHMSENRSIEAPLRVIEEHATAFQGESFESVGLVGLPERAAGSDRSPSPQEPRQQQEFLHVFSLLNVPELLDRDSVEPILLDRCRWNIGAGDIGVSFNARYSIVFPRKASLLLSQQNLTLQDSIELLSLGRKILRGLRRIRYSNPLDPQWKDHAKAQSFSLLVIQLDTLLRISNIFPGVTQTNLWWTKMVEKCNLTVVLQSPLNTVSSYFRVVGSSRAALESLVQQTRPSVALLKFIYSNYESMIKRKSEKYRVK